MPLVSVIIPNYNHANYLPNRIDSVLNQSYKDFELIILDDKSNDGSLRIIEQYKLLNPDIIFSVNEENSGNPFFQWFKGISQARGKYIWIAESDDYAHVDLLKKLVPLLEQNENIGLAYSNSLIVDEKGVINNELKVNSEERWQSDFIGNGIHEIAHYLCKKNSIPNASAVLFRQDLVKDFRYKDFVTFKLCGDWLFWIKILLKSDISYSAEPLNFFRKHSSSVTFDTVRKGVMILEAYKIIDFIKKSIPNYNFDSTYNYWAKGWAKKFFKVSYTYNLAILEAAKSVDKNVVLRLIRFLLKEKYYKLKNMISR